MKVHRCEFEVMWMILAMFGNWEIIHTMWKFEPQPARQDRIREQTYSPYQSRPPPLSD